MKQRIVEILIVILTLHCASLYAKPSLLEAALESAVRESIDGTSDYEDSNADSEDSSAPPSENEKAMVLELLMQQVEVQDEDDGTDDSTDETDEDGEGDDYLEAKNQMWGMLIRHAGRKLCQHLRSSPRELEQSFTQWLDDETTLQQDETAELQKWKIFRKIKKFLPKLRNFGRKVCNVLSPMVSFQSDNENDNSSENTDDDVEVQFLRLLRRKVGSKICRYLRSPTSVLQQNIDNWIEEDAKEQHNDIAELQWFRFGSRIRRYFPKLRRFGRKVCDALNPGEVNVALQMESEELDKEDMNGDDSDDVSTQFWKKILKKIGKKILRKVGKKVCDRIRSRPDAALEESVNHFLETNLKATVMQDQSKAEAEKFGRRLKKFFRKIGKKACNHFFPGTQEYDDDPDYNSITQEWFNQVFNA